MELVNPFVSVAPEVKLVSAFERPYDNAVATARTCYSPNAIVDADEVSARPEQRDRVAQAIYRGGHHTTLQHAHFQFALTGVSRQFLWSFLHSHPFFNSEQVSQRYVEVKPEMTAIPALSAPARELFERTVQAQHAVYRRLIELLRKPAAREYYRVFPARRKHAARWDGEVDKRSQEIARYVLPVATRAHLYHTVSGITLMRYWRLCEQRDAACETRYIVGRMVQEVLAWDPQYAKLLQEPIPHDDTPEAIAFSELPAGSGMTAEFVREFDAGLAGLTSRLIDRKGNNERLVADAVRQVLGLPRLAMSDTDAIRLALDPQRNRLHGETLTLTTLSKLARSMSHASYSFRKKLSHTADSQDQRHRMTPGSRPLLTAHATGEPDFITPILLQYSAPARSLFHDSMHRTWEAIRKLRRHGVSDQWRGYLLPNATAVRFTESADLLHLHHKLAMRLCYASQEELWQASVDEARQISKLEPLIGRYLLPPCGLRALSVTRPICPEGVRFCGVHVWKIPVVKYGRVI